MNRDIIEQRDKIILEKFRSIVENKSLNKKSNEKLKSAWSLYRTGITVFCCGLIVAGGTLGVLVAVQHQGKEGLQSDSGIHESDQPQNQTAVLEVNQLESTDNVLPARAEVDVLPAVLMPRANVADNNFTLNNQAVRPTADQPETPEVASEIETSIEAVKEKDFTDEVSSVDGLQVAELVSCSSVVNRTYNNSISVFSFGAIEGKKEVKTVKPYVWMTVLSEEQPFTLNHVYYHNGQPYCSVPLKINYPRMRTWSNVTLRRKKYIGTWQVDVVTESGIVIKQLTFTVEP